MKAPVEVVAGGESVTFSLAKCDAGTTPAAIDQLSILARPGSAPKPTQPIATLAKTHGPNVIAGIRRIDARLVERLGIVADHFRKAGETPRVTIVSGYRPRSTGSFHSVARALDFRIEGVTNEALVAFCKTLPDTGCGYYPNSIFIHMDVREPGGGHVSWIDASRPGEPPRYVTSWPERKDDGTNRSDALAQLTALPPLPADEHPVRPASPAKASDAAKTPAAGAADSDDADVPAAPR
jgi:hypothetical protein